MKNFWALFWTQFFGAINDNVLKNALVVMVTYQGLKVAGLDSQSVVALAGGIFIVPFFLFSMVAGQFSDKHEKSQFIRAVKIYELGITLLAAVGFYYKSVGFLLVTLFMMGVHSTIFGPVKYSALPDLVGPEKVVKATAYVESGTFLGILLGTLGGGILISLPNGDWVTVIVINLISIIGIITAFRVPQIPPHADSQNLKITFNPITPLKEVYEIVKEKKEVISAVLAISWFWFFGASIMSVLPAYCKDFLKVNERGIVTFLAMWTIGIGAGSLLCERLSKRRADLGLVPVGAFGLTLFLVDLCRFQPEARDTLMTFSEFLQTKYGWHLLADFFFFAVSAGLFIVPLYTLMQERTDKSCRSRVIASNNVINAVFMVGSTIWIMVLHNLSVNILDIFLLTAGVHVAFCLYLFLRTPEYLKMLRERF